MSNETQLILKYDPEGTTTYGYFRCQDCGSAMFGGGPFMHRKGCTRSGYDGLEYHLGDVAIERILSGQGHLNPIEADELRRQLPEDCIRVRGDL